MPQPATHYLVVRKAIPESHYNFWDQYKPYFGLGSSAPDLFYFPKLPLPQKGGIGYKISWEHIANPMHSNGSYDMFCALLDIAKRNNSEKQLAFAFGYYSHVITDCIFHPYIYRKTKDYWFSTDVKAETAHKIEEFNIDSHILSKHYPKEQNFNKINIACPQENTELLDFEIAEQLNEAFSIVYKDYFPVNEPIDQFSHPVQSSYKLFSQYIKLLLKGELVFLFASGKILNPDDIETYCSSADDDMFHRPYNVNILPRLSPENLFDISCKEASEVFLKTIDFWKSDATSSADFFKVEVNQASFIGKSNFNLDTGLPSYFNNYKDMREGTESHFSFKSNELVQMFTDLARKHNLI